MDYQDQVQDDRVDTDLPESLSFPLAKPLTQSNDTVKNFEFRWSGRCAPG